MTSSTVIIYQRIIYQIFWNLLTEPNNSEDHRVVKDWWKVMRCYCWALARAYSWYGSLYFFERVRVVHQHFHSLNPTTTGSKSNSLRNVDSARGPAVMVADSILEKVYLSKLFWIRFDKGFPRNIHIDSVCTKLVFGIYVIRSFAKYCPTNVLYIYVQFQNCTCTGLIYPHI